MDAEAWKELHGIIKQLHGIIKDIASPLISLAGVWLGWRLGTLSQRRQRKIDRLEKRLDALREIMSVVDNIPPDVGIAELQERFSKDPEFYKNLVQRLVRLFGLRTELTPYLDPNIRSFIDGTLRPFFMIGAGLFKMLPEKEKDFAYAAIELRQLVNRTEEKLIREHEKLTG